MFWLGLLLPICFVPGYTGASVQTQWALLSLALPILLWRPWPKPTGLHYLGAFFIAYAFISLDWAIHPEDAVGGLWLVVIWTLSFQLGFMTLDPTQLWKGLSTGLSINAIVALTQWFGFAPVEVSNPGNIAGLLFNPTLLSVTSALVIIACIESRLWLWTSGPFVCLTLSGSHGGWFLLAVAAASKVRLSLVPILIALGTALFIYLDRSSDRERLEIWGVALKGLTLRGWSVNSFVDVYYISPLRAVHPEFVHNDYLQLAFEFGIIAIIPIALLALAYIWRPSAMVIGIATLGGFYFPLYAPITAFLACFAVGHSLRGFSLDGFIIHHCRFDFLSRLAKQRSIVDEPWREDIPVQSRTSPS